LKSVPRKTKYFCPHLDCKQYPVNQLSAIDSAVEATKFARIGGGKILAINGNFAKFLRKLFQNVFKTP
jgi:hypothetical protein